MEFEKLVNFFLSLYKFVGFSLDYERAFSGFIVKLWSFILTIINFVTLMIGFHYVFSNIRDLENIVETFSISSQIFLTILRMYVFISYRGKLKDILKVLREINDKGFVKINMELHDSKFIFYF